MSTATRGALLALLLAGPRLGWSQQPAPTWPRPGELIKEGVALHDKEDYAGAIAKYQAVTRGDSAYATAQSEMALSLEAAGKHEEAIAAARRALALNPNEPQTYNTLASAQEELKQLDAALATYAQARKLFPYNANVIYNQGVLEFQHNRVAEALVSLQHSAELRPTHPNSHRLLGSLAAQQGQPAHALISWLTSLALLGESAGAHDLLVLAERLSEGAPVFEAKDLVKPVAPNDAFAELDQLLESKVALQPSYTSKVKFAAAVVKQTQLLVEKFPVDGPATDFWISTYGPMVQALRQGDNLTAFTYYILQSADDKKAAQWLKANKSKVEAMAKAVSGPLLKLRTSQQVAGQPGTRLPGWFADNKLVGLGPGSVNDAGEFKGSGAWIGVDDDLGYVNGRGQFDATGRKVGEWKVLRPDGSVERIVNYNAQGEREGLTRDYHPNGQLASESTYRAGKIEGVFTQYNECGVRSGTRTFKAGDLEGPYATYFDNGQVRMRLSTRADKADGLEEGFYPDGTPEYTSTLTLGDKQGPFTNYYANKALERKGTYDHNQLEGPYTEYHPNGAVREEGRFGKGNRQGLWKEYFSDGKLSVEKTYDENGDLHGTYHDYDENGHLDSDTEYVHGRITHVRYFNAQNQVLLDKDIRKGRVAVELPHPGGQKNAVGTMLDGHLVGEWRWHYPDGTLREVAHYSDQGVKTGLQELYYDGGGLKSRARYDEQGQQNGLYEEFTRDGQPSATGYYLDGERHGRWQDYYANGQLSEEYEYYKGVPNGVARSYEPGGKLTQERLLEFDQLRRFTTYDSTGRVLTDVPLRPDTREYVLRYPNGQPYYRTGVGCFGGEGPATWYRPDGTPEVTAELRNGQRHGPYRGTFADGKPSRVGGYLKGRAHGEWLFYYPGGQLRQKGRYLLGDEDGEWVFYFPNGQVEMTESYRGGQRHGLSRRYNPAGELLLEKTYRFGALLSARGPAEGSAPQVLPNQTGTLTLSFANGKPAAVETYDHSRLTGPSVLYYASGAVFRRSSFEQGLRTGLLESFYPNGKPMEQEYYRHGELDGRCRYYRPDGTLEREETYRSGERRGPSTTFDATGKPVRTEVYWNQMVYGTK